MTDPQNLPELEPQASDESSIETRSKRQEKSITRNVEWFVNDFLPWSLGGLGGVGVIGFIAHSQILEAIVTFLVTVVVVSWAKYTCSFTRTFSTIAGKRGDQDAKSLAQWIGNGGQNIAEVLRWYCSGFTKKYLKDQAVDCQDLDTEGLSPTDLRIPMLREVFVPLRLSGPVGRAIDEHDLTERELKRLRNAERDEVLGDLGLAATIEERAVLSTNRCSSKRWLWKNYITPTYCFDLWFRRISRLEILDPEISDSEASALFVETSELSQGDGSSDDRTVTETHS